MSLQNTIIDELRKDKICEWIKSSPKEFIQMVDEDSGLSKLCDEIREYKIDKCKKFIRDNCGEGNVMEYENNDYFVCMTGHQLCDMYITIYIYIKCYRFDFIFNRKNCAFVFGKLRHDCSDNMQYFEISEVKFK